MKVPWEGEKCILCLNENGFCEEHIIPNSLGGKLTCCFLCRSCNSILGHNLESKAKSDPSVLLAVKQLERKIPDLSNSILDSHPHIGHSGQGANDGYIKKNKYRVKSRKLDDNSLIQPTDDARKSIIKKLEQLGVKNGSAEIALAKFDGARDDKKIEIVPGLEIIKWRIQKLELDLSKASLMNPQIPVKIAFEFLALHLGEGVYTDSVQLQEIRDCLLKQELNPKVIKVDQYSPIHGICFEGNDPYARVQVRLFGWLAFRVHFLHVAVGGYKFVYTHEINTQREVFNMIG